MSHYQFYLKVVQGTLTAESCQKVIGVIGVVQGKAQGPVAICSLPCFVEESYGMEDQLNRLSVRDSVSAGGWT